MFAKCRGFLLLVSLLGVSGAVAAAASSRVTAVRAKPAADSVVIQAVFDPAGNPLLVANFSPDGSLATAHWSICPPNSQIPCQSAASKDGELAPGPEPAGTRFVASANYAGATYSASVTWHGQVQTVSTPTITGNPREGDVVEPIPASWTGGWGDERDQLGIEACASASGVRCRMLGGGELGCPDNTSRTPLGGWFTGWYLFALDARLAHDEACAGTAYVANADLPVWRVGQTVVRSHALGKITGSPRPIVRFFRPALLSGRTLYVARVRCLTRCTIRLLLASRSAGAFRRFSFRGSRRLGVNAAVLRPGAVTVFMYVDDSPGLRARSTFG